jgi:hypothetical protein
MANISADEKMTNNVLDEKMAGAEFKEVATAHRNITPLEIQGRFETLRHLSEEQMTALNKKLVRRLDWRLMPCITIMFLMKYESSHLQVEISRLISIVTSTASTCPMRA